MTDLNKLVLRRTKLPFAHYRRRLVVALEPGDTIAMRLERTRTIYRVPLSAVYRQLAEWHAMAERARRKPRRRRSL